MNVKGKTKMEKGITLIALIITIVVLLILAAVAINSIQNDGILSYAQNVANKYNQAQKDEQDVLGEYLNYLDKNTGTSTGWVQDGLTVTNGLTTLYVGDYVNYTSGVAAVEFDGETLPAPDTVGWQVLGAENGELLLITADVVNVLNLQGRDGYNSALTSLKTMCEAYGEGNYATGARSIDVEDINRITGYNPNELADGTKFFEGTINEYGKTITYSITADGKIEYTDGTNISGTSEYEIFIHPDGRTLASDTAWGELTDEEKEGLTRITESITVTNSAYLYNPETLTIDLENLQPGAFGSNNEAYKMLFGSTYATLEAEEASGTSAESKYTGELPYWLASTYEVGSPGDAAFGMFDVDYGLVDGYYALWDSVGDGYANALGVRPVVSLRSDITLTSAGSGSWSLPTN